MKNPRPVRERLLDAADALLFIEGAFATPVDDILKSAGASPPSLYTHFGNKEGLITAALRRRLEIWTAVWDEAVAAAPDARGKLLALWSAQRIYQSERLAERWCAFSGTAAAVPNPGADLQAVLDAETTMLKSRLRELSLAVTPERGEALGEALVVTYAGTLALMLRQPYEHAIDEGEAAARSLVDSYTAAP